MTLKKYSNQNANINNLIENLCGAVKIIVVCWSLFTFLIFLPYARKKDFCVLSF